MKKNLGVFFAALAIALHALWPLIAQAKPKSVALVPLCTVGGETHYQEVPLGDSPAEQKSASHFEHCSLCTPGGAVLHSQAQREPFCDRARHVAPGSADFSILIHARVAANPRAPPSIS